MKKKLSSNTPQPNGRGSGSGSVAANAANCIVKKLSYGSTGASELCLFYRRYLRLPCILSLVAFAVNVPAFFELDTVACAFSTTNNIDGNSSTTVFAASPEAATPFSDDETTIITMFYKVSLRFLTFYKKAKNFISSWKYRPCDGIHIISFGIKWFSACLSPHVVRIFSSSVSQFWRCWFCVKRSRPESNCWKWVRLNWKNILQSKWFIRFYIYV